MENRKRFWPVVLIAALLQFTFRVVLIAVTIVAAALALPAQQAAAALYESYETGNGVEAGIISPTIWVAQTFVASTNHTIKYVQLHGRRETSLTSGNITVAIRATDTYGQPSGPDLTAASEAVTIIPTSSSWFTIYLPTCGVTADARYALVVRVSSAATGSEFWWSGDTVKGYPSGAGFNSTDGGGSWMDGGIDQLFRVYGDAAATLVQTGAATADSYPGFDNWVGPSLAYSNGDGSARGKQNVYHYYNNYNFSIPSGATITGIEVRLDASYYPSGWTTGTGRFRVRLSWNHGTNTTSLFDSSNLTSTETTYYIGGPSSTWGRTWSPAELANTGFEVQLVPYSTLSPVTNPNQYLVLDYCPVTVYYTLPQATLPTVTTAAISGITTTTAIGGGTVTADGGSTVSERGICWGTTANPIVADNHTSDGSGNGAFISTLSGLTPATAYHVRAYATNSVGTAYGDDLTFSSNALLSLMLQGTGSGIVHSDPPDINCSSGSCQQDYPAGASITLTPTITGHSLFQGWSGDCTTDEDECIISMDQSRVVLATFDINPAEAIWVDPGVQYYDSIGSAYLASASSGSQIKVCRLDITGSLVFDLGKSVTIKGGYDSTFSSNSSATTVIGTVTVKGGKVVFEHIIIRNRS